MSQVRPIKSVCIGDGSVGKTALLMTFATNHFPSEYVPTVFDNYNAHMMIDGKVVSLGLWDTAGQEDYDAMRPLSYPMSDVVIICMSIASRVSADNVVNKWAPEISHFLPQTPVVLVGCKKDLRDDRNTLARLRERGQEPLSYTQGVALARKIGAAHYVESSAFTGENITDVFRTVARAAMEGKDGPRKPRPRRARCAVM